MATIDELVTSINNQNDIILQGFIVVVAILAIVIGLITAKAFSFGSGKNELCSRNYVFVSIRFWSRIYNLYLFKFTKHWNL